MKNTLVILPLIFSIVLSLTACGTAPDMNTGSKETDTISVEAGAAISEDSDNRALGDSTTMGNLLEFTAKDSNEDEYTLSDFTGKDLIIINFWSTTCPPCIAEMPELEDLRKTLPENIEFITYCLDGLFYPEALDRILNDTGFTGITLVESSGDLEKITHKLMYTPTTLFFSGDGIARGSAVIGAQRDTVADYTSYINDILSAMGKSTI